MRSDIQKLATYATLLFLCVCFLQQFQLVNLPSEWTQAATNLYSLKINNSDIASSPCSVLNGFSHSTLPAIMFQNINDDAVPECTVGQSKESIDSNLDSTAWKTNLVWIQRWLAKSHSSIAGCYESGILCASHHRSILAIKASSTLKIPTLSC